MYSIKYLKVKLTHYFKYGNIGICGGWTNKYTSRTRKVIVLHCPIFAWIFIYLFNYKIDCLSNLYYFTLAKIIYVHESRQYFKNFII